MPTITPLPEIEGVLLVDPDVHRDARGSFVETYRRSWFPAAGEMVQGNVALRSKGSVVGLHFHLHQTDYWQVQSGTARVVLHDLRQGSPTEGATVSLDVVGGSHRGVLIPRGVAHGFAAITDVTLGYLVDGYYDPSDELGVAWDDPDVAADWGVTSPVVSDRDAAMPKRSELPDERRPQAAARPR